MLTQPRVGAGRNDRCTKLVQSPHKSHHLDCLSAANGGVAAQSNTSWCTFALSHTHTLCCIVGVTESVTQANKTYKSRRFLRFPFSHSEGAGRIEGRRGPEGTENVVCSHDLYRTIQLVNPKVLVVSKLADVSTPQSVFTGPFSQTWSAVTKAKHFMPLFEVFS